MATFTEIAAGNRQTRGKTEMKVFDFTVLDFATLVKTTAFVDKTLMIRDIFCSSSRILITAPPRFGKSMSIDMVKRFLEIEVDIIGTPKAIDTTENYNLFKDNNLEICNHKEFFNEHFGKYPVIHIDYKPLGGASNFINMLDAFRTIITDTFNQHSYLLHANSVKNLFRFSDNFVVNDFEKYYSERLIKNVDAQDLISSFKYLSIILYRNFKKKVFVLIDNYDEFITSTLFKNNNLDADKIISFIYTSINNLLTDSHVERALLTGVLPVASDGFLFHGNNIDWYSFMSSHLFCKYFGLTSDELGKILEKLLEDVQEIIKIKRKIDKYYCGYESANQSVRIYSIWSVLQYMCRRNVQSYWCSQEHIASFKPLLKNSQIRGRLEQLLSGHELKLDISKLLSTTDVLQLNNIISQGQIEDKSSSVASTVFILLYHFGYLSISKILKWGFVSLKIPNEEIKNELAKVLFTIQTLDCGSQEHDNVRTSIDPVEVYSAKNIIKKLIKHTEEINQVIRRTEDYKRNLVDNQSGRLYSILSVLQYPCKRTRQSNCGYIEALKPFLEHKLICEKIEQLLKTNELKLDTSGLLSTNDFLQLIDIIIGNNVNLFSSAVDAFFILLLHLGYLSIEVFDGTFVYIKILNEEIKCKLANIFLEINQTLYNYSPKDAAKIVSALNSFQPDSLNTDEMFETFGKAVKSWNYNHNSEKNLLTNLFMNLVPSADSQPVFHTLWPSGCVVILVKNKHQVAIGITIDWCFPCGKTFTDNSDLTDDTDNSYLTDDTDNSNQTDDTDKNLFDYTDNSDPPDNIVFMKSAQKAYKTLETHDFARIWTTESAQNAHKTITDIETCEEQVFNEYNSMSGKVLIGIGHGFVKYNMGSFGSILEHIVSIAYSYQFKDGHTLEDCKTLVI